jgi:tartrate dehydratase alpha subunit/fumarate hydratase class I-like protein
MLGIGIGLTMVIAALYFKNRLVQRWKGEHQNRRQQQSQDRHPMREERSGIEPRSGKDRRKKNA